MATPGGAECAVLGRRVELDTFRVLLEDLAGGRGRCVLIDGEPGIGKTALLDAVLEQARAIDELTVCSAACDTTSSRTPLSVLLKALSSGSEPDAGRIDLPSAPDGVPLAAAVERVFALIDQRSADGRLLLAVDDLHAADEATLLVWQRLCAATARTPLLLMGTLRPVPRRTGVDRLRRILKDNRGVSISLDRLPADDVAALTTHLLGAPPGPRLTERLTSAGGNPLYVRELVDALVGSSAIEFANGKAELADAEPRTSTRPAAVVDSLAAAIAGRLGFLGAETLEALRTAALLGPEFAVADLSAALRRPAGLLALAVQEGVAAGVVEPVGLRLRFRHGLLRQALYETIPAPQRSALRRAAARALMENAAPVDRVAELITSDLDAADGWETEWVAQHADDLARRSPELAAELFEHILGHADLDEQRRAALLEQLTDLCFTVARYDQAADLARQTLDHARDPARRGHAAWIRANALDRLGRLPEAEDLVARINSEPDLPEIWQARLLTRSALTSEAAAYAISEGERLHDPMTIGYALLAKSYTHFQASDMPAALQTADRALTTIGRLPKLTDLRLLLSTLRISALTELDRFTEATGALRAARAADEHIVGPARLAIYAIAAAELAYQQGRWDDALAELAATHGVPPPALYPRHPDTAHGLAALISVRRDDQRAADHHLKALTGAPTPYALLAQALHEERAGRPDAALNTLRVILEPAYEAVEPRTPLLPLLVRLALTQADAPAAATATDRARGHTAQWCRALTDNDPNQLSQVANHLRSVGRKPELAWALEDLAVLQAPDSASAVTARATLAEARALSTEYGAAWDTRRATARLRTLGVRPANRTANRPRTGPLALTETERRVADLAARGMTNPDIAATMSLSRRTVETHVSRILAKLGARSRHQIAEALRHE
jgi:DNA-binding CsgD family transcriptional regulator/tetratricopeptide (TPR) repeat protein